MALLSSIVGGDGGNFEFAPETITNQSVVSGFVLEAVAVTAGVYSPLISATGKFSLSFLRLSDLATENHSIRMTIDGVEIWNIVNVPITGGQMLLFGGNSTVGVNVGNVTETRQINTSMLLEIKTTNDTAVTANYQLRPVK